MFNIYKILYTISIISYIYNIEYSNIYNYIYTIPICGRVWKVGYTFKISIESGKFHDIPKKNINGSHISFGH